MPVALWMRRLAVAGVLLCFTVVVLGAYVRLSAAGLGCPDWPGCYGHLTPMDAGHSLGKAWREMLHRYAAGALALVILGLTALAISARRRRPVSLPLALALLATLIVQAALGMLTVTWQLKPLIVTLHLLFGMTTLGLLWWLWMSLPRHSWGGLRTQRIGRPALAGGATPSLRIALRLALLGLAALGVQIALGGWTSSNYAAVACPDFPRCQNAWWPHTDYGDAFVLWRGLALNYEGGVLDNPARVAIHLTHRLGAVVTTMALGVAALFVIGRPALSGVRISAYAVLAALALQLAIGGSMVLETFPLLLSTAHTAGAALLLLATLALVRSTMRLR